MPRVLVVEDNEEARESLTRYLETRGFDVIAAADGQQGVDMARSETPDIILMDMNMPVLDGWEATRQLKAAPETNRLPVIALTAFALEGDREQALAAGCAIYHPKPVNLEQLMSQVEVLIKETPPPAPAAADSAAATPSNSTPETA